MDAKEARAAALEIHEMRVAKELNDALALIQQRVKEGLFKTEIPCADLCKEAVKMLQKDYNYTVTTKRAATWQGGDEYTQAWVIKW